MPSYERELSLVQGYNFKKDVQLPIGFITTLKIGTNTISDDQIVTSPMKGMDSLSTSETESANAKGALKCVSVLKKVKWDLGDTDPIEFEGTLSVTGKQQVMGLLYATMININVEVSWVVYEYDPLATLYYAAFATTAAASSDAGMSAKAVLGLIKKDGENLAMTVSPTPATDVQSPENYDFTLQIVPQPSPQMLYLAAASTRKTTKSWGRQGPGGKKQ